MSLQWVIYSRVGFERKNETLKVFGSTFFAPISAVYGILLAFLLNFALEQYRHVMRMGAAEVNALYNVYNLTKDLKPPQNEHMKNYVESYFQAVTNEEWVNTESVSPNVTQNLQKIWNIVRSWQPESNKEINLQKTSLEELGNLSNARRSRLLASRRHIPSTLWALVFSGAVILIIMSMMVPSKFKREHQILVGLFTFVITFLISIIWSLSNPFLGAGALNTKDYQELKALLEQSRESG